MARARSIKPGFFKNEYLVDVSCQGRLLFIGLWTLADREGRLEYRPKRIKAELFPYEDCDVDSLVCQLEQCNFVKRYEITGVVYLQILNFVKHQKPHPNEKASDLPDPEDVGSPREKDIPTRASSLVSESLYSESPSLEVAPARETGPQDEILSVEYTPPDDDTVPTSPPAWGTILMQQYQFARHEVMNAGVIAMFRDWCDQRLTWKLVRDGIDAAHAKLGNRPDGPAYYRRFVNQVAGDVKSAAATRESRKAGDRHAQTPQRNHPKAAVDRSREGLREFFEQQGLVSQPGFAEGVE